MHNHHWDWRFRMIMMPCAWHLHSLTQFVYYECRPRPTVIPEASYNIPISLLAIAGFEAYESWTGIAAFTALLGAFLGIQATRIR